MTETLPKCVYYLHVHEEHSIPHVARYVCKGQPLTRLALRDNTLRAVKPASGHIKMSSVVFGCWSSDHSAATTVTGGETKC